MQGNAVYRNRCLRVNFVIIPSWWGWWQKLISIICTVIFNTHTTHAYTAAMSKVPQSLSYIYAKATLMQVYVHISSCRYIWYVQLAS